MKSISKRVRDEAILICAIHASTPDLCGTSTGIANLLGASAEAARLAYDAWDHATNVIGLPSHGADFEYVEAEYLLREGWTPS